MYKAQQSQGSTPILHTKHGIVGASSFLQRSGNREASCKSGLYLCSIRCTCTVLYSQLHANKIRELFVSCYYLSPCCVDCRSLNKFCGVQRLKVMGSTVVSRNRYSLTHHPGASSWNYISKISLRSIVHMICSLQIHIRTFSSSPNYTSYPEI